MSRTPRRAFALLALCLLAACGGGAGARKDPPASVSAVIGPAGGRLDGPDGVALEVPPGALTADTTLTIARTTLAAAVAAGAPALEAELVPAGGAVYELTPHGAAFAVPVRIGFPVPASGAGDPLLVGSPGEEWALQEPAVEGGKAWVARNRLSWGMFTGCSWSDPPPDSGCVVPTGGTALAVTPAAALTKIQGPWTMSQSSGGIWQITGTSPTVTLPLTFTISYSTVAGCQAPRVELLRERLASSTSPAFSTPPVLVEASGAPLADVPGKEAPFRNAKGSFTFAPVQLTHLDAGWHAFFTRFRCTSPTSGAPKGGGDITRIQILIPAPTGFTIGGTVSGLTGSGLVLQNGGADDLAVSANGAFTFPTAVASGAAYDVTVKTQPAGQVCTVGLGQGTAEAHVTTVHVSCTALPQGKAWQVADLLEADDVAHAALPALSMNAGGDAVAVYLLGADVWARRLTAGAWAAPEQLDALPGLTATPDVAIDAAGNALAVWPQLAEGHLHVFASRFTPAAGWSAPHPLEANAGDASSPRVALLPGGDAMVVWSQEEGSSSRARAARLHQGVWEGDEVIDDGEGYSTLPHVVDAGGGAAAAVWTEGGAHVKWNRFDGTGWSTADWLSDPANGGGDVYEVALAGDGAGFVMAAWHQADGARRSVVYRTLEGGSWVSELPVEESTADFASDPAVAMNASGAAVVAWREGSGDGSGAWARPYGADGVFVTDPFQVDGGASVAAHPPAAAIDPAGRSFVAWSAEEGAGWAVRARLQDPAAGWAPSEVLSSGSASHVRIAMDGAGNAAALWLEGSNGKESVWFSLYR